MTTKLWALSALLLLAPATVRAAPVSPINAVVGDASWIALHGRAPTPDEARTRDAERHRVHLRWIESRLRAASTDHLDPARRARRAELLDALAEYRRRGVRPASARAERLPRWMDEAGRLCAVGYLMERSAGRAFVKRINERHEYGYLLAIDDPELTAWVESSGFTARELASIQPSYAGPFGAGGSFEVDIDGNAVMGGVAAGLFLAANVGLLVGSLVDRRRLGPRRDALPITQLTFGALELVVASVLLGLAAEGEIGGDWRDPVLGVASSVMFLATLQIVDGTLRFALPSEPGPRPAMMRGGW